MKTVTLKTGAALDEDKYKVYLAARMYSRVSETLHSPAKKLQAERMAAVIPTVFHFKDVYITYRKTFIAVKIDDALVADKRQLKTLEAHWDSLGIVKRVSTQGITYRIPK